MPLHRTSLGTPLAAILLVFCALLLFWPLLGQKQALYFGDISLYFVPQLDFQQEELLNGRIPLWNPYLYCGTPFIGNPQTWALYPSSLLLYTISPERSTGLIGAGHCLFASFGTLLFLRRRGLGAGTALIGALVWGFGGALVSKMQFPNMVQAASFLPWILWAAEGTLTVPDKASRLFFSGVLALVVGLSLLAAHPQMFLQNFYLCAAWVLWRVWPAGREERRGALVQLLPIMAALVLGVALAMGQLLPIVEMSQASVRPQLSLWSANRFHLGGYALYHVFLLPNFYGNPALPGGYEGPGNFWEPCAYFGWLPFALAMGAGIRCWKLSAEIRFWVVVALIALWLSLGLYGGLFAVAYFVLPGVKLFHDPARWLLIATFAAAVLTAQGAEAVSASLKGRGTRLWFLISAFLISAVDVLSFSRTLNPTAPAGVFAVAREQTFGVADQGRFWHADWLAVWKAYVSPASYAPVRQPEDIQRFLKTGAPNLPLLARRRNISGYEPVHRADMAKLVRTVETRDRDWRGSAGVLLSTLAGERILRFNRSRRETTSEPIADPSARAMLWTRWEGVASPSDALFQVTGPDWDGRPRIVGATSRSSGAQSARPLAVRDPTPQRVEVILEAGQSDGLLVLSDTLHPGWNAFVQDRPAALYQVNATSRGVVLPPGINRVSFCFSPVTWRLGLFISMISLGILSGVFAFATTAPHADGCRGFRLSRLSWTRCHSGLRSANKGARDNGGSGD